MKSIPRAIYYMNFMTPFKSLWKIIFRTDSLKSGFSVTEFQTELKKKFHGAEVELVPHARIGFYLILKFLRISHGSEILCSPIGLPEMLKMIRIHKLTPRFVGYKKNSLLLDLESLQVSQNTKAFFYTPISGIQTDMTALVGFCKKHDLILIQDLTQSFGAEWKKQPLHRYADYNIYSLCDLKTLHTHRGGLIVSNRKELAEFLKKQKDEFLLSPSKKYFLGFIVEDLISSTLLRRNIFNYIGKYILKFLNLIDAHLVENLTAGNGLKVGSIRFFQNFMASGKDWMSDLIPDEQKYVYTNLQAEIGLERWPKLVSIEKRRKSNVLFFYSNLNDKARNLIPDFPEDEGHIFWRAPLIVSDFPGFQKYLLANQIDVARSNLPWLPDLLNHTDISGRELKYNCVYMPIHHYLNREDVLLVAAVVNKYSRTIV